MPVKLGIYLFCRMGKVRYVFFTCDHPVPHETLKPRDACPLCPKGKVYRMKDPGVVICLNGQPPIDAAIYELEKLRCNLCGKVFTAAAPQGVTGKHYDETAKAMMAVLKYGYGFPWYRLDNL